MALKTESLTIRDNVNDTKKAVLPLSAGAFAYRGVMFQNYSVDAGAALLAFAAMVAEMPNGSVRTLCALVMSASDN